MVKKKVGSNQLAVDGDPTPSPSPFSKNENGEGNDMEDVGYEVGAWKGFAQYRCKQCGFDTLKLGVIEVHVVRHKDPTPPPAPPQIDKEQEHQFGEGSNEVFEVELREIDSTVDEDGNEVKTFTLKEN